MWSGPRNISTALMRSFGARADCAVSDEPFYGCYLKQSHEPQPMAAEIIADMDCNWESVAAAMQGDVPGGKALWYQKHMPHHMIYEIGVGDFPDHRHAFLIREPERVIASYANKRVTITFDDLRYDRQATFFEQVMARDGEAPVVIESAAFLHDPDGHLRALCAKLEIAWDPAMLSWRTGIHDTDGIWASHWYDRVISTTGFGKPQGAKPQLDDDAAKLAAECRPFYEAMLAHAIKP